MKIERFLLWGLLLLNCSHGSVENVGFINRFFTACKKDECSKVAGFLRVYPSIIDRQDIVGNTGLHLAIEAGSYQTALYLMQRGASVALVNVAKKSPLHAALLKVIDDDRWYEFVQLLLEKPVDVNAPIEGGITPLHIACYIGSVQLVNALIQKGAHIEVKNKNGYTPLHLAVRSEEPDVVAHLLFYGADPNSLTVEKKSCLHEAVEKNNKRIVRYLLQAGADVTLRDGKGRTPYEYALALGVIENAMLCIDNPSDEEVDVLCNTFDDYLQRTEPVENICKQLSQTLFVITALATCLGIGLQYDGREDFF